MNEENPMDSVNLESRQEIREAEDYKNREQYDE